MSYTALGNATKKKKNTENYAMGGNSKNGSISSPENLTGIGGVTKNGGLNSVNKTGLATGNTTKVGKSELFNGTMMDSVTKTGASNPLTRDANTYGKTEEYKSKYDGTIDDLLDQIVNRKQFSYDFNADPLYQQYKDNYVQQGNQAMMNTMANMASLTGGYGNSYAATAGALANQQYLTQLNNVIPELYSAAMDKYNMDSQNLINQYNAVANADDRAYGRYADDRAYQQWLEQFGYQKERDQVSDNRWNQEFDYQKTQDERAYQQWLEQFGYQKERDQVSDNRWNQEFDYQKTQDDRAYQQWQDEFSYQKEQDALKRRATEGALNRVRNDGNDGNAERSNLVDTAVQANKIAESKSAEDALEYLEQQVKNGSITYDQAVNIYDNIKPRDDKPGTAGPSANNHSKRHIKDVSMR